MPKKEKRKRGRPRGGQYPKEIRNAWMEYKRAQRQAEKEAKRIINVVSGKKRDKRRRG